MTAANEKKKTEDVLNQIISLDKITSVSLTYGDEKTVYGKGCAVKVTVDAFCYCEGKALWVVTYESDSTGVKPAFMVHADPKMYGHEYSVQCVESFRETPQGMVIFEDMTKAILTGMKSYLIAEYQKCVGID